MDLSPTTRALVAEAAVTSLRALPEHLAAADVLYALGQMRAPLAACPPPLQVTEGAHIIMPSGLVVASRSVATWLHVIVLTDNAPPIPIASTHRSDGVEGPHGAIPPARRPAGTLLARLVRACRDGRAMGPSRRQLTHRAGRVRTDIHSYLSLTTFGTSSLRFVALTLFTPFRSIDHAWPSHPSLYSSSCLQQYSRVPAWAFSPKEVAIVVHSLGAMDASWTALAPDTQRAVVAAVGRTFLR